MPSHLASSEIVAHIDGGSRGNPGPAAYGVVVENGDGAPVAALSKFLGRATNNVAEYEALLAALDYALEHHHPRLRVLTDSELLARQIEGRYKVKSPDLKPLHERAHEMIRRLERFSIRHVPREENRESDRLVNQALDAAEGKPVNHKDTKTQSNEVEEEPPRAEIPFRGRLPQPEPLPAETNRVAQEIVDSAYSVHSKLGPGLLESVYETCLIHELNKRELQVERQVAIPVSYDGITLDAGFRLDLLVEKCVIVELKSMVAFLPVQTAQLLTYLKLSGHRLGLLINFNVPLIRDGIKRVVL